MEEPHTIDPASKGRLSKLTAVLEDQEVPLAVNCFSCYECIDTNS